MWSLVLTLGLKLLDLVLARKQASDEAKKAYLQFVDTIGKSGLISVSLHQSYIDQRQKNIDEINGVNK